MRQLLIFLKEPEPGKVKTRLVPSLGERRACEVYRACVELTLDRLAAWRDEAIVCVDPPDALGRVRGWLGSSWSVWPQEGADLGERLAAATGRAFKESAHRVVVIGTDSPWLQRDDIDAAFGALADADMVLGPAEDGGYYLIGLSRSLPELFEGIEWSTASVCEQTTARARALHLVTRMLRLGYDVDLVEDVARFVAEEGGRSASVPHLVEAIGRLVRAGAVVSGRERCRN